MASTAPSVQALDASLLQVWRVDMNTAKQSSDAPKEKSVVAEAVDAMRAQQQVDATSEILPGKLLVEVDRAAGRFVNTLLDSSTNEVLRRYPSEGQLAFSRGVAAYMQALDAK